MRRCVLLLSLLLASPAMALEGLPGIGVRAAPPLRVKLTVNHFQEVEKDMMEAVFRVEGEERDLNRLASMVRQQVSWAIGLAQESPYFQVSTGDYQVYAIFDRYDPQRFSHWWGAQLVRIKSTQMDALKGILGKLQSKLMLLAIRYGLSPKTRHQAEERLLKETLDVFRSRADLLKDNMKAREYTILDLKVSPVQEEILEEGSPVQRLSLSVEGSVELH